MSDQEHHTRRTMTAQQSHEEIQHVLRAEIDDLRRALASHSSQGGGSGTSTAQYHQLKIKLLHKMYAAARANPALRFLRARRQAAIVTRSALFDAGWYLQTHADVAQSGLPAARHYVQAGAFEGRDPGLDFSSMAYYLANPDVADYGWPALVHYEIFGKSEGRRLK